jgi:inner membrane protein
MTSRTHDLAAALALGAVVLAQPPRSVTLGTALLVLFANQVGGIVPDIDQPTAPLWRNLPIGRIFGKLVGLGLGGHRTISHSVMGMGLFGFAAYTLLHFFHPVMPRVDIGLAWWAFMIGMLSHLVMDSFTKEGVPWLLPIPVKFGFPPLKSLRIVTGKKAEVLMVFPALVGLGMWLCVSHYQELRVLLHAYVR